MTDTDLAAENTRLRARIEELTDRVITAETANVDADDLKRENTELRRALADVPTTEAAIAKLRAWFPGYEVGATHVMMTVAMARKLLDAIDETAAPDVRAPRPRLPFGLNPVAAACAVLACGVASVVQWRTGSQWDGNWAGLASLPVWIVAALWIGHRRKWAAR